MSTPFTERLRTDASNFTALNSLLGTSPFRWYDEQLSQGSAFPAVVVRQVTNPKVYSTTARLATNWRRMEFTIWGGQFDAGAQSRLSVESALLSFLDQWQGGIGISQLSQYPNNVLGSRDSLFPQTDGAIYQRQVDVQMFGNDSL